MKYSEKQSDMLCCGLCNYTTKFPSWMARHSLVHSGTRRHVCTECGATFKSASALSLHRKKHFGDILRCDVCDFTTRHPRVLDRHRLVHEEECRYQCSECRYSCKRLMDLRKHMVSMHSGRPFRKRSEEQCALLFVELGVPFEREIRVTFPQGAAPRRYARLDFFWRDGDRVIVFEVDEYAHGGSRYGVAYECLRMELVWSELSKRGCAKVHFIRYNPHMLRVGPKPTQAERTEQIRSALEYQQTAPLVVTYLYYKMRGDLPEIAFSPDYTLKDCVRSHGP